jgi:hypothetical protein
MMWKMISYTPEMGRFIEFIGFNNSCAYAIREIKENPTAL